MVIKLVVRQKCSQMVIKFTNRQRKFGQMVIKLIK